MTACFNQKILLGPQPRFRPCFLFECVALGVMGLMRQGSLGIVGLKNCDPRANPRAPRQSREAPWDEVTRKFYARVAYK